MAEIEELKNSKMADEAEAPRGDVNNPETGEKLDVELVSRLTTWSEKLKKSTATLKAGSEALLDPGFKKPEWYQQQYNDLRFTQKIKALRTSYLEVKLPECVSKGKVGDFKSTGTISVVYREGVPDSVKQDPSMKEIMLNMTKSEKAGRPNTVVAILLEEVMRGMDELHTAMNGHSGLLEKVLKGAATKVTVAEEIQDSALAKRQLVLYKLHEVERQPSPKEHRDKDRRKIIKRLFEICEGKFNMEELGSWVVETRRTKPTQKDKNASAQRSELWRRSVIITFVSVEKRDMIFAARSETEMGGELAPGRSFGERETAKKQRLDCMVLDEKRTEGQDQFMWRVSRNGQSKFPMLDRHKPRYQEMVEKDPNFDKKPHRDRVEALGLADMYKEMVKAAPGILGQNIIDMAKYAATPEGESNHAKAKDNNAQNDNVSRAVNTPNVHNNNSMPSNGGDADDGVDQGSPSTSSSSNYTDAEEQAFQDQVETTVANEKVEGSDEGETSEEKKKKTRTRKSDKVEQMNANGTQPKVKPNPKANSNKKKQKKGGFSQSNYKKTPSKSRRKGRRSNSVSD